MIHEYKGYAVTIGAIVADMRWQGTYTIKPITDRLQLWSDPLRAMPPFVTKPHDSSFTAMAIATASAHAKIDRREAKKNLTSSEVSEPSLYT